MLGFTVIAVPHRFQAGQSRTSGVEPALMFIATAPPLDEPTTTSADAGRTRPGRSGRQRRNRHRVERDARQCVVFTSTRNFLMFLRGR